MIALHDLELAFWISNNQKFIMIFFSVKKQSYPPPYWIRLDVYLGILVYATESVIGMKQDVN